MREWGVTIPVLTLQEMQNHKFRAWFAEFEPVPSAGKPELEWGSVSPMAQGKHGRMIYTVIPYNLDLFNTMYYII